MNACSLYRATAGRQPQRATARTVIVLALLVPSFSSTLSAMPRQITSAAHGHVLTNAAVWSADSRWIVYDTRSSPDGSVFDGTRIERVEVATGRVELLYESSDGACCGVVTTSPADDRVVFIHGPERPTADWSYAAFHRRGVVVDAARPGHADSLDARDLVAPFTPGSLRGGTHVHLFSSDGRLVHFTYEDALLAAAAAEGRPAERNLRGIGVSLCGHRVRVPRTHPRNHNGSAFSVLVTMLADAPRPGSDEISRACEEAWVGSDGYLRPDGSRQRYAIAFQGTVVAADGREIVEAFIVDLPDEPAALMQAGEQPLTGTPTSRPAPPRGVSQRRLTFTAGRPHPGIAGPRHWLRSSPDGSRIAFLMRDDAGHAQLFAISPLGGEPTQVTSDAWGVASAFSWSPDGRRIAYVADGSVMTVDVASGESRRLTEPVRDASAPRAEACVFSPDGSQIAYVRTMPDADGPDRHNQLFVVAAEGDTAVGETAEPAQNAPIPMLMKAPKGPITIPTPDDR